MHSEKFPLDKTICPKLIAITGGIGSGKSYVCDILARLGYKIYNCDIRAKSLMEADSKIKSVLMNKITRDAVNDDGSLNRKAIAEVVFNDSSKLAILDKSVHSAVTDDLLAWREKNSEEPILFVETAIPFKSNLYRIVDDIWEITAPEDLRITRAMKRDNSTAEAIRSRISSQADELPSIFAVNNPGLKFKTLINDGYNPIADEIKQLLETY